MNLQEFRAAVQEAVRSGFLDRLEDYLAKVDLEGSIEDRRKAVELTSKLADALPDKEMGRSLPVVHISFGAGGMTATVSGPSTPPALVEEVDSPADPLLPTPAMRGALGVNLDVEPLLFEGAAGA